MEEILFSQPCLIKKNTKFLRKQLESIGYKYAPIVSRLQSYNNLKEPWIVCAYNMYTCCGEDFLDNFIDILKSVSEQYNNLNTDIKQFSRHEEDQFLIWASKK